MDMENTTEPQTVTQEDLDLLNGLRLGFLPILSMDRQGNRRSAEAWSTRFIQGQLANPAIVDIPDAVAYLQVFADKLLILAVEVRRFTAIFQSKLTLEQASVLKAEMASEVSKRDRKKVEEVEKQRKEQAEKPHGSPLKLSPEEKVIKNLIKTFPNSSEENIRGMAMAMFPDMKPETVSKVWKAMKG